MSFFKLDDGLLEAPTAVESLDYALYADQRSTYTYPIGGWYWFDTRQEALAFFNLPPDPEQEV